MYSKYIVFMQWIQENVITRTISINILFVRCVVFLLMCNNVRRANECNSAKFSRELHIVNLLFMLFHLNLATQKLYRNVTTHFFYSHVHRVHSFTSFQIFISRVTILTICSDVLFSNSIFITLFIFCYF